MNKTNELKFIQNKICNFTLFTAALFSIPALAASLARIAKFGFAWDMWIHIVVPPFAWILVIFRKSAPYSLRAGFVVGSFTAVGISGILKSGMISGSIPLLIVTPTLVVILFRARTAYLHIIVTFIAMIGIAYAYIHGQITETIDIMSMHINPLQWVVFFVGITVGPCCTCCCKCNDEQLSERRFGESPPVST